MATWHLRLSLFPELFAICRLPAGAAIPAWAQTGPFASVTRTPDELSILCPQSAVPVGVRIDGDWRCLKVEGPFCLDSAIGVLASLAVPLAAAQIGIFVLSTYDTDYLLVKDAHLARATEALGDAGHRTQPSPATGNGSARA